MSKLAIMKRLLFQKVILLSLALMILCALFAFRNIKTTITIEDPLLNGTQVGKTHSVKGKVINIPDGHFLWVFIHRIDFEDVWYPQFYDVNQADDTWKVMCTFGNEGDIGWDFEIAAAIVNNYDHLKLKEYRKTAMRTGNWSPIEIPSSPVPPVLRTVEKVRHD